ncbi:hypothetical protein AB1Y20_002266 [Prymnesium parvum]|uniref:Uncharacterized protein n=1 Tax=Prymnesium parvum TaxID=97485 RepID=A0AB34J7G9_PRYPA
MKARSGRKASEERAAAPGGHARERGEAGLPLRVRDLEDDVFDVAHNSMLRYAAQTAPHHSTTPLLEARLAISGTSRELALDHDTPPVSDAMKLRQAEVQAAVDATWAKANAMQEKATEAAVRSAVRVERERISAEHAAALAKLAEDARGEVELAKRRAWEASAKEQEKAIAEALSAQALALQAARQDAKDARERMAAELAEAYAQLKQEAYDELRLEHATSIRSAVQHAWDQANRQQEAAVRAAKAEAAREARREVELRFAAERVELGAEYRKALQQRDESRAEGSRADKEELKALREEVSALRAAARDAEAKAALEQRKAVLEAVRAAEDVARKASRGRAGDIAPSWLRGGAAARREVASHDALSSPRVRLHLTVESAPTRSVVEDATQSNALVISGQPTPPQRDDLAGEWED